jgi:hypothetical protein
MRISFDVKNQIITRTDRQQVIANSSDYIEAEVTFSEDWATMEKTIYFKNGESVYAILLNNNKFLQESHLNLGVGTWKVYVIGVAGDQKIITNECNLAVGASGYPGAAGEPTESIYQQLMVILQSLHTEAASEAVLRSAVEKYILDNYDSLVRDAVVVDNVQEIIDEMVESGDFLTIMTEYLPVVMPEMYGAAGDGVTNDTAALEDAFSTGKPVLLTGTYLMNASITVAAGTKIIGGAIKIADLTGFALVLSGDNEIDGVTFTDNHASNLSTESAVIRASGVMRCKVTNCTFNEIHLMYCINFWGSEHLTIEHNRINTYNHCGIKLHEGCRHASVSYNYVYNGTCTTSGVHRYPIGLSSYRLDSSRGSARFISCVGNYIEDLNPFWEGIDSHGICNSEIRDNYIKGTKNGIVLTHPTSADPVPTENVVVENNTFIGSNDVIDGNRGGIIVAAYNIKNVKISNNRIKCGEATSDTNLDSCVAVLTEAEGEGVEASENITITDNVLYGRSSGVYVSTTIKGLLIKNNSFDGMMAAGYPAINIHSIKGFTNVNIVDNTFGASAEVNRSMRLTTENSLGNSELIHVARNRFVDVTETYRDATLSDAPVTNISLKIGGQIGDFVPNGNPGNNDVYGWVAVTDADLSNGTKATWKAITIS